MLWKCCFSNLNTLSEYLWFDCVVHVTGSGVDSLHLKQVQKVTTIQLLDDCECWAPVPFPATPDRPLGDVQLCPQALPAHRYLPQLGGELMETDSSLSTPGKLIPFGERELPEFHTTCLCVQTPTHTHGHMQWDHPRRVQDCPVVHCQLHSCKSQFWFFSPWNSQQMTPSVKPRF